MKNKDNKNKDKDVIFKLTISVLLMVFGVILLIDQLNIPNNPFVKFVDDLFTPWYSIIILFIASSLLAYAIIKKAPIIYVLSMFFAGIFLFVSITSKIDKSYAGAVLFVVPMFVGIGCIIADRICKWSPKILRFGAILTVASAIVLVSVILDTWKYVIPIVIILIGIAYMIFELVALKHKHIEKTDDHYVTYTSKDETEVAVKNSNTNEKTESSEDNSVDSESDKN